MACGDKYRSLIVTNGGYTPNNPFGAFALPYDYSEWRELGARLVIRTQGHLDRLQGLTKTTEEQVARANELAGRYNTLVDAYETLPGTFRASWSGGELSGSISRVVGICIDATCVMDSIDEETKTYGVEPPGEPSAGRDPAPKALDGGAILNTAMFIGLGYLTWKLVKS